MDILSLCATTLYNIMIDGFPEHGMVFALPLPETGVLFAEDEPVCSWADG